MQTIKVPAAGPWKTHIPSDGSNIGGTDPLTYAFQVVPGKKQSVTMTQSGNSDKTGKGYPAWMLYPAAPIVLPPITPTMQFELDFDFWCDALTQAASNVRETDSIFIVKGTDGQTMHYNGSAQIVIGTGELEVGQGTGGWQKTGVLLPPLPPNQKAKIKIAYTLDTVKHTISVTSYSVGGVAYQVPTANQDVPASPITWSPGIYLQFQQGGLPAGNPFTWRLAGIKYRSC
jgi:hypothetical protein